MIIVDASIAIKWLNEQEENSKEALFILEKHITGEEKISIPNFLFIEVANVLATKPQYSAQDIADGLQLLSTSHLIIYELNNEDITTAAQQAKQYNTSVYDMLYAVIAKKNNCTLITADEKFAQKVNFPFVKLLIAHN